MNHPMCKDCFALNEIGSESCTLCGGKLSKPQGFAAISEERQREIASMGGKAAHAKGTAHRFTSEEAREAGKKGGIVVSADREHMSAMGHKGGLAVSRDREHMAAIGRKGGRAISADRDHMAEIGSRHSRGKVAE